MIARVVAACLCLAQGAWAEWLVSSFNDDRVFRFATSDGAYLGFFATNGAGSLSLPHDILVDKDENVLVSSAGNDRILRYDGRSGAFLGPWVTAASGGLDYPVGLAHGPDGNLYVSSQLSNQVLRFSSTNGAFLNIFVSAGSGGLVGPSDLAFGPDANLYVAGRYSDRVYRYNGTNGAFMDVFVTNGLSQPFGLTFGPDGNLYVVSGNDGAVKQYSGTNGMLLGVFATNGPGSLPIEAEFGPDGNLYVANYSAHRVMRFNGTNGLFIDAFITNGSGGLSGPNFLQWRPDPDPAFEAWKSNRFTAAEMTNSAYTADSANPDGDAFVNRDEYIADTDPTNAASVFPSLTNLSGSGAFTFTVSPTSTGRVYDVYAKSNLVLDGNWTATGLDQSGTGGDLILIVTNTSDANFYRTGVRLP